MAATLPPAPPARRLLAWVYTGPLGHLWSTSVDIVVAQLAESLKDGVSVFP